VRDHAFSPWHPAGYQLPTRFVKVYALTRRAFRAEEI
jgi:hypothetical protein